MGVEIVGFEQRPGLIDGMAIVTMKQVTDERGTIRELFRRSAFHAAGVPDLDAFVQINVTESRCGAVRGMHAEAMRKLLSVVTGEALGVYVDLRVASATFGVVDRVELRPGVQVMVPSGVANGFQSLVDGTQYVYCFDREWTPDMAGWAFDPLDAELAIGWPILVDPDDPAQISVKDRNAVSFGDLVSTLRENAGASS